MHGLVFNSPHSGRFYPKAFLDMTRLDRKTIRRSEDLHVDSLFADVVDAGMPLHAANFPRTWVDVNREPYELDPRMFDGPLPPFANTGSVRVTGGLGTIARVVGEGVDIYARRLPVAGALERIETAYKPFHRKLKGLIGDTFEQFGHCVLIDCHSMPSNVRCPDWAHAPDIIIGDRFGMSASPWISDLATKLLRDAGYSVMRNKPYAGGYITEHYGRPLRGLHALQIEINRGLYMDEGSLMLTSGFVPLRLALGRFALAFANEVTANLGYNRLAAE